MKQATALFLVGFSIVGQVFAEDPPIFGFTASSSAEQRKLEAKFDAGLKAENLREWMQHMTAQPHHLGSPYGKQNAEYMAGLFRSWGYDTRIEEFRVLFPTPKTRLLEMLSPERFTALLSEPKIPEDRTSGQPGELPVYNAYSIDGDVTGELVYVNFGLPDDYEELKLHGIDVKGKIVIARYYGGWRGLKPKEAAERGAIGCILYTDPQSDGYFQGDVYPKGGWRNEYSAQRGSVIDYTDHSGDVLTPFVGATIDAPRIQRSESRNITKIPVLPISYHDALPLLRALEGPVAPESWRGALPIPYHLGRGPARVHLKISFQWDIVSAYDVIARMEGAEFPDQWILRGNHHDAWVYGAMDPVSGIVAVMEEARGVAALAKTGWRPKRTLIYAAWDGEEEGLMGSTEWVETHEKELREKAVAYINTDSNARGFLYFAGSPVLQKVTNQAAADVLDPQKRISVKERARAYGILSDDPSARDREDLLMNPPGSGSDYVPFLQHLGIASMDIAFGDEDEFGQYHSIYDSFDHYIRFQDPTFEYGVALAKTGGRIMLRLANAEVLPLDFMAEADSLQNYIGKVSSLASSKSEEIRERNRRLAEGSLQAGSDSTKTYVVPQPLPEPADLDFSALQRSSAQLKEQAALYQNALDAALRTGSVANANRLNAALQQAEQSLAFPGGVPGRNWYTHAIQTASTKSGFGDSTLSTIREPIRANEWKSAQEQIQAVAKVLDTYRGVVEGAAALLPQIPEATLTLAPCRPAGVSEDLQCGTFKVPENRSKPEGRQLQINVVVLPALESASKKEPLFDLAGTEFAELYAGELKEFRRHRDIVLVDQRGMSPPALNCPGADLSRQGYLREPFPSEYVKRCAQELGKSADLNSYLTSIAMEDVDAIRKALGYDSIHLSGASYFSRAVLEYIRRHGEHVKSAILRSPVPPDARMPLQFAAWAQRALDLLFADCASDDACMRAFPTLRDDWKSVLSRLSRGPARVAYAGETLELQRDVFAEKVRLLLYSPSSRRSVPFVIHEASIGNFTPLLDSAIPKDLSEGEQNMDGWYLSVMCPESTDFARPEEAAALSKSTDFGMSRFDRQHEACALWPHPSLSEAILRPVVSDVPVLIFAGAKDPITPPIWAEKIAETLPRSRMILIPEGSHVSSGLKPADCLQDLAMQFLDGVAPGDLNTGCAQKLQPPPFQVNARSTR